MRFMIPILCIASLVSGCSGSGTRDIGVMTSYIDKSKGGTIFIYRISEAAGGLLAVDIVVNGEEVEIGIGEMLQFECGKGIATIGVPESAWTFRDKHNQSYDLLVKKTILRIVNFPSKNTKLIGFPT